MCYVDYVFGNELTKKRSTKVFTFMFTGGEVVYRYRTKSINALRSTESELIVSVTVSNTARFLWYMLWELGFPHEYPTAIYEDNDPTIDIVNSSITTKRNHFIDVLLFAIQGWKWK